VNLRQLLQILRLRWWLVLVLFVLTVAGAFVYSSMLPKRYSATTAVLLDVKTDPLVATLAPNLAQPAYIATQTEIIRSDRLAARVVSALGLAQNAGAVEQWREATEGRVPLESFYGERLLRGLQVEPSRGSSILNLTFVGSDPKFAAAAANTFAKAYIDFSVELKIGPAREYASFFDERLKALRSDLEVAQGRVADFQRKKGILVTSERVDIETARLNALEAAMATAMSDSAETSSRQRNTGTETSVDVQQSSVVQGLKSELARAETKLNELSTTYGPNHPTRIQAEAQIAELKQQIANEMRRVQGAAATVNRIAGQKIGELRSMVDNQKRAVLSMRADRDEASVLIKDLETAQRAYEQVAQRRAQLANESQAEQATARILSPATEPLAHSFPNIPKNMVAAVIVGLLLGVGAAVAWEMLDRRIRSAHDMHMVEGVPVLGVMSANKSRAGDLRRLVPMRRPPQLPPQLTMETGPR
jgi:chain length determinant protein EpsF